ncbi:MAG: glucokinase [Chlamydiales bacterium]
MLIAGDIGGTKTNIALFEEGDSTNPHHLTSFHTADYPDLQSIVKEYKSRYSLSDVHSACFAIAGPVQKGICKTTNLQWVVNVHDLAKAVNIENVYLINDLEANAYALPILPEENLRTLYPGKGNPEGNQAVVSPGTGLGEAGLYWDGKKHHPFACEGGHCEFGPRTEIQIDLCRYIYQRFGHASYERILSGPGLYNIYQFYRNVLKREESGLLKSAMEKDDPAKVITQFALNKQSDLCVEALSLFVSILGSETSNCVLKYMAVGGVFLGGGIPPKILPFLEDRLFLEGFFDKGRFRTLLESVPIKVISDDRASLKGAAYYCQLRMEGTRYV